MSINERIDLLIKELFSGNKRAFSRAAEISTSVTENIVGKRQGNPSFEVLEKIARAIPNLNSEWLIKGEGKMLRIENTSSGKNTYTTSEQDSPSYGHTNTERPFLDPISNTMNLTDGFMAAIEKSDSRNLSIPFIRDYDFSLRVHGDSMINPDNTKKSIEDSDIVACKLWKESYIRWGEVYAIATSEGYMIKKIIPSETPEHIRCVSFNEAQGYLPYDLPLCDISDWAIVVGKVSVSIW